MSGIQISGLLSNSAFDWKSVVDQLIAADSTPITNLNTQKSANTDKITALTSVNSALTDLQDSLQAMRSGNLFASRAVTSDTAGTTWELNSATGASVGSYKIAVQQLATTAQLRGTADISGGISATDDVTGLTVASLPTATAVTAGTFSVNGQKITVALTDSLDQVFSAIHDATGGEVTATYDAASDKVTLTGATGPVTLGAGNDTSNFLSVFRLGNSGTNTVTSATTIASMKIYSPLASSGLRAAVPAADGAGNGTFSINGVSIAYNLNTDSLSSVLSRITASTAGVTASYDSTTDRVVLANKSTGDLGITVSEGAGGLLGALGVTGGTLTHGKNALFTVNDGPVLSSNTNTLDSTALGVAGLSVKVNSATTQTLQVGSDSSAMQTGIQGFLDKFNALQALIDTSTKVTVTGATVTTSVLSDNQEVQNWQRQLHTMAFNAISGLTGSINRLDNLGIDFDSTSGKLVIKDSGKLNAALSDHPDDVQEFFLSSSQGLVPQMYGLITKLSANDKMQQNNFAKASADIDDQIATLQTRLDSERESLTNSFLQMLDAQSAAQSQNTYLTNTFFKNNSSG